MSQVRNMKWLNERRIVYRQDPINDMPDEETDKYNYYFKGTYEYYHLFNSKAKITTYKSLKWHFLVLMAFVTLGLVKFLILVLIPRKSVLIIWLYSFLLVIVSIY